VIDNGVEMIRPLEKTIKGGKRYERSRQTENAIATALTEDIAALPRRAEFR
jgi:hypothetical protein